MNIFIINQHANNLGDEAAGVALIERVLSYNTVEKVYLNYIGPGKLHYDNDNVHQMDSSVKKIGLFAVLIKILCNKIGLRYEGNKYLKEYSECMEASDYIVVSPSGADLGHYKGWSALLNICLGKSYKKKILFHLNSIDKCENIIFEYLKKRTLRGANIYVREQANVSYLKNCGFDAEFGIDTAFLLKNSKVTQTNVISFVYSEYSFMFDEKQKKEIERKIESELLVPMVSFSKKMGYRIQVLPHLLVESEKEYLFQLIKKINSIETGIAYYNENVVDAITYQEEIAKSKVMVAMRYHPIVLAAKNGVPFISLSYDSKMDDLANYLGVKDNNINLFQLEEKMLEEKLFEVNENREKIVSEMNKNIEKLLNTAKKPTLSIWGNPE